MKNILTNNLGLKIISIIFAIGLWVIVVNLDDPVTTRTFKNVPVSFINENILSDEGKVYQVLDGSDKISFTVRAKRSVVESLTNADFKAEADFSERVSETTVPIKISALKCEDSILDINLMKNTVKISIEELVSKTLTVDLQVTGNMSEGLTVGNAKAAPSEVVVSGPESYIGNIDKMVVTLDSTEIKSDVDTVITGQLYNKNGEVVNDDKITCDTTDFNVTAKLLHTKSVDLDFSVEGNVKNGYRFTDIKYEPTTVMIAGEQEDLDKISTIVFPSALLNIEGAQNNIVKKVNVDNYLPESLVVANKRDSEIEVTLEIVQLAKQEIRYPVTRIDVLNTPMGLDYSIEGSLSIGFELLGLSEDLSSVNLEDLDVSIDLKGIGEGTHKVPIKVTSSENIELADTVYIEVTLSPSGDGSSQNMSDSVNNNTDNQNDAAVSNTTSTNAN